MLASTSTSSNTLVARASNEGLKHLYRTILTQARLLASTFDDPIIYSSHRYLARRNLEPLLTSSAPPPSSESSSTWPLPTSIKRILRSKAHRRHLADANYGWEHAAHRALSLAYARSGKLRRDALSDLSPTPSKSPKELKYEQSLRKKDFSPVLTALLTSSTSMDGVPVKSISHLTGRPPPPYLPGEDDALVKHFGKATGRRRVANATGKFVRTYLRKVMLPLDAVTTECDRVNSVFAHLERKARPPSDTVSNSPKRFSKDKQHDGSEGKQMQRETPYLDQAKAQVDLYRSNMNGSEHRKQAIRQHGWASHPKDYSHSRTQRRLYGRILDDTPLLVFDSPTRFPISDSQGVKERKNDPLGIRQKLSAIPADIKHNQIKFVKSRYAVGPKSGRGKVEVVPRGLVAEGERGDFQPKEYLVESEMEFLRQQGLL